MQVRSLMTPDYWGRQAITSCYELLGDLYSGGLHVIIALYFYPMRRGNRAGIKLLEEGLSKIWKNLDNKLLHLDIRNVDLNQNTLLKRM